MKQYLDLLQHILDNGNDRPDRTGTGTRGVFGYQMRFNMGDGFPLLTTKKVNIKAIIHELLWFLKGSTNIKPLQDVGVHIWDEWADKNGELGPVYGKQWRKWYHPDGDGSHIDQIARVVTDLQKNPYSRRHIVTAWNVGEVDDMKLPPCHMMFQFYVTPAKIEQKTEDYYDSSFHPVPRLSLQMYQRSADSFLGLPFNIASYALLLKMMAQVVEMQAHELIIVLGDAHLYSNHLDLAKMQLKREPRLLPEMAINPEVDNIDHFTFSDFNLLFYRPHDAIKADISV